MTDSRAPYTADAPSGDQLEQMPGPVLLDFGTNWCGHCARAAPHVASALGAHPEVRHVKVEDGEGRALGRAFGVKLWPTLVFLRDGVEQERLVRPTSAGPVADALARLSPG